MRNLRRNGRCQRKRNKTDADKDRKMKPSKELDRDTLAAAIDRYILGRNAERNRKIFYDKMVFGPTFEALAEKYDLSVTQVKRIVYECEETVFRHI